MIIQASAVLNPGVVGNAQSRHRECSIQAQGMPNPMFNPGVGYARSLYGCLCGVCMLSGGATVKYTL